MEWIKYADGGWPRLLRLNLKYGPARDAAGLYVVFYARQNDGDPGPQYKTIKLGWGYLRETIKDLRKNKYVAEYAQYDPMITWVEIDETWSDGALVYLNQLLDPLIKEDLPQAQPVVVHSPFMAGKNQNAAAMADA
jgi:hypothetical protein